MNAKAMRKYRKQSYVKERERLYRERPDIKLRQKIRHAASALKIKIKAFERLGGVQCVFCGCKELMFLTVDHVDNNGNDHRKQAGTSAKLYRWIISATDAKLRKWNMRILCSNCNLAIRNNDKNLVIAAIKRDRNI